VKIDVSREAKDFLGNAGYSPAYGARPLARLIEKEVLNRLAILILRGSIKDGETARVTLDRSTNKIVVIPNHFQESSDDDEEMVDSDEAMEEVIPDDMDEDLYD